MCSSTSKKTWLMHKAVVAHGQLVYPNPLPEGDGAVWVYLCGLSQQPLCRAGNPSVLFPVPAVTSICRWPCLGAFLVHRWTGEKLLSSFRSQPWSGKAVSLLSFWGLPLLWAYSRVVPPAELDVYWPLFSLLSWLLIFPVPLNHVSLVLVPSAWLLNKVTALVTRQQAACLSFTQVMTEGSAVGK